MQKFLDRINSAYPLRELSAGDWSNIKVSVLNFRVRHFEAAGLGHVSVMEASGMLGLMKMETLIINPFELDAPTLSFDLVHAMGNEKYILEVYDTMLEKKWDSAAMDGIYGRYHSRHEDSIDQSWYARRLMHCSMHKAAKKAQRPELDAIALEMLDAYVGSLSTAPSCDTAAKKAAAALYSDDLLEHGGMSTDAFLKKFGKEKTAEFFKSVFFGA